MRACSLSTFNALRRCQVEIFGRCFASGNCCRWYLLPVMHRRGQQTSTKCLSRSPHQAALRLSGERGSARALSGTPPSSPSAETNAFQLCQESRLDCLALCWKSWNLTEFEGQAVTACLCMSGHRKHKPAGTLFAPQGCCLEIGLAEERVMPYLVSKHCPVDVKVAVGVEIGLVCLRILLTPAYEKCRCQAGCPQILSPQPPRSSCQMPSRMLYSKQHLSCSS